MIEIPKTNINIIEDNRIEPLDNFIDKKKERINQIININTSADKDNSPNEQLDNKENIFDNSKKNVEENEKELLKNQKDLRNEKNKIENELNN